MKLTQTGTTPLVIFIAIIVVIATLMFRDQFVSGHENPTGCDVSTVGLSIVTSDGNGAVTIDASHGTQVFYQVILSIPELPAEETACNYGGGQLSITLPGGETSRVAGFEDVSEIPLVQRGSVYESPVTVYTVNQNDAEDLVLTVLAIYAGWSTHSVAEGVDHPTADTATVRAQIQLARPSIAIGINPAEQVVYEDGNANFKITISNTGGFELSNVQVVDSLETNCERGVGSLGVGATTSFDCQMIPAEAGDNFVTAIADVIGGVPTDLSSVQDTATASIAIEATTVSIDMTPALQRVRVGNPSSFEISVQNPNTIAIVDVAVSVPESPGCSRAIGAIEAEATVAYECTSTHPAGTTLIVATVEARLVDVSGMLTDSAQVEVAVFELDLAIDKTPKEQSIREGETASFTVTVSNHGNTDLADVVIAADSSPDCSRSLGTLRSEDEVSYDCASNPLDDDMESVITVTGTAPDGDSVQDSDSVMVRVIHPNTVVALTELDTTVLRLVVQVLTITESNIGDSPLTDVYVDVEPSNVRLTADSKEFIGGDDLGDGILDPGETWEWRLVIVSVAGDALVLASDAPQVVDVTATGHGTDPLGGDITFPAFATEQDTLEVPIMNE